MVSLVFRQETQVLEGAESLSKIKRVLHTSKGVLLSYLFRHPPKLKPCLPKTCASTKAGWIQDGHGRLDTLYAHHRDAAGW